jgi:hypothetical protein
LGVYQRIKKRGDSKITAGCDFLMTDTIEKTPRQKSIENGEQIVITIMAYFVLFEVFTLAVKFING